MIVLSYSLKKTPKPGLHNSEGLNANIPGIQNFLCVVEIIAKDSTLLINSRFEKHLKFIFKNLFQVYHRIIIDMR